jgi:hypothetical protein
MTDILELTEAVNADGSVRKINPSPPGDMPQVMKNPASAAAAARIEPDPPRADGDTGANQDRGRLLSAATSEAAASAFAGLGTVPQARRNDRGPALIGGERTLDEIVRETLRPLLQEWLDRNLVGIVERLVRDEIARVAGEAALR